MRCNHLHVRCSGRQCFRARRAHRHKHELRPQGLGDVSVGGMDAWSGTKTEVDNPSASIARCIRLASASAPATSSSSYSLSSYSDPLISLTEENVPDEEPCCCCCCCCCSYRATAAYNPDSPPRLSPPLILRPIQRVVHRTAPKVFRNHVGHEVNRSPLNSRHQTERQSNSG